MAKYYDLDKATFPELREYVDYANKKIRAKMLPLTYELWRIAEAVKAEIKSLKLENC